jgi:uncharacterized protein with ACT and thioredoxin-like domain
MHQVGILAFMSDIIEDNKNKTIQFLEQKVQKDGMLQILYIFKLKIDTFEYSNKFDHTNTT